MGDIGDVWNIAKDTATLFANGQSQAMGSRACAVPSGMQPADLDWANQAERTLTLGLNWSNLAREWFGASSGTAIRIGVTWQAGGSASGRAGSYLHDAYLWAVADAVSLGVRLDVTGQFGDAVTVGNTAELSGAIRLDVHQYGLQMEQHQYDIRIRGNGSGTMREI
jgi:hypothetical protein